MADLQRRTPRAVRERRAYRLVLAGTGTGIAGVVCLVLSIVGFGLLGPAILLLIIAALCAYGFMRTVGAR